MFEFIRNIFNKKKEIESISLANIEKWFNEKADMLHQDFNSLIENTKSEVDQKIDKIRKALKELEEAKLKNPDVPGRALNFMEGNRQTYIKRVNQFLDKISTEKINPDYLKDFESEIENFGRLSARPYQIMQEFFAHESSSIAAGIRELNNIAKKLKESNRKSRVSLAERIKEKMAAMKKDMELKKSIHSELEKLREDLEEFSRDKKKFKNEIESLKSSEPYKIFRNRLEDKEATQNKIEENKHNIMHSFHVIEAAMKKFERIVYENSDLVKKYLENPISTLLSDKELKIVDLLTNMKQNLVKDAIELKESKKQRILTELKSMNKDFFSGFLQEYEKMNEKLDEINQKISEMKVEDEISEFEKKLVRIKDDIFGLNDKINELKKKLEKISIDQIKDHLEKKINEVLNLEIRIS